MVEPRNLKAPEVTEQDSRTWAQVVAQEWKEPPQITENNQPRAAQVVAQKWKEPLQITEQEITEQDSQLLVNYSCVFLLGTRKLKELEIIEQDPQVLKFQEPKITEDSLPSLLIFLDPVTGEYKGRKQKRNKYRRLAHPADSDCRRIFWQRTKKGYYLIKAQQRAKNNQFLNEFEGGEEFC